MQIVEEQIEIAAPKDWVIAAALFSSASPGPDSPIILMSSAAGVPHGYYANFARYLIEQGAAAVLTYDYRGMGGSTGDRKRWPELRMFDWATLDFPATADWLRARFPEHPLIGMGHSYGGQALGLSGAAHLFDRFATVATMSGYWRGLDTPWAVYLQTQIVGRSVSRLLGYVPKRISPGDVFPGTIFLDWADWIASPNYWFDARDVPGLDNFSDVTLPYLSIGLTDDPWGTERAIGSFMSHYSNADLRKLEIEPGASGKIGHLGFFRQRHRDAHWSAVRDFVFEGIFPEGAV